MRITEGGGLSGRQAQEPCGRGYLNSNRRTSHLCISCSLALVSLRYRPLLWPLSSQCFLSFVLCARSFSAVVSPGIGRVGQLHPHCTDAHPFVYGFSSTPVLKEMLQKLQFSHLFHPLFHLTTSQMTFPFFSFPLHISRNAIFLEPSTHKVPEGATGMSCPAGRGESRLFAGNTHNHSFRFVCLMVVINAICKNKEP